MVCVFAKDYMIALTVTLYHSTTHQQGKRTGRSTSLHNTMDILAIKCRLLLHHSCFSIPSVEGCIDRVLVPGEGYSELK